MKNTKTRFKRLLRTKNSEFFQIEEVGGDRAAFLLYIENQDVEQPIDIYLMAHFQISDKLYEEILSFNDDMLSMKPTRHYFMKKSVLLEKEFEFDFPDGMTAIGKFIDQFLQDENSDIKLGGIQNEDFNYLSQD